MRYLSIALVLLFALAVGCAPMIEGKKIDGAKTKQLLAPGTNESRVVQMFGEPQQKEQLSSGETKYIYYYRERNRLFWHADPKDQQRLEVFFKNGTVNRYRYVYADVEPIMKDIPDIVPEKKK
jgi:outer membrane protein assembly factor BamE (lipoprotein component of BamABCDE complex)